MKQEDLEDSLYQNSSEIQQLTETLHSTISYYATDLTLHEHSFMLLAIILHIEQKKLLNSIERRLLEDELHALIDKVKTGSLKITELHNPLSYILENLKYKNPKVKILSLLIEIEHLCCLFSASGEKTMTFEGFETFTAPLISLLQTQLTSIQSTLMSQELESFKKRLENYLINQFNREEELKKMVDLIISRQKNLE